MRPRTFRLLALLAVAAALGLFYLTRDTGPPVWERPLKVVVYPENADGSAAAQAYIAALSPERSRRWKPGWPGRLRATIWRWKSRSFSSWPNASKAPLRPITRACGRTCNGAGACGCGTGLSTSGAAIPDVTLVARYREAERADGLHSLGIAGMNLALANLTADESFAGLNEVLLVHELMHTVGADDLYDRSTGLPVYPEGFVQPDREPLYPQSRAEIMAGRIPVGWALQARRLEKTAIGRNRRRDRLDRKLQVGVADRLDPDEKGKVRTPRRRLRSTRLDLLPSES